LLVRFRIHPAKSARPLYLQRAGRGFEDSSFRVNERLFEFTGKSHDLRYEFLDQQLPILDGILRARCRRGDHQNCK
jgi:hypothetical protein